MKASDGEERLRDRGDAVGALLRAAAEAPPAPGAGAQVRVWAALQARAPRHTWLRRAAFGGLAATAGALAGLMLLPAPPPLLQAEVRASPDAKWSVEGDVVRLDEGALTFHARAPMRVVTPRAAVRVLGTVFAVEARSDDTRVWVREGVVEVRSGGEISRVAAGESWPRGRTAPKFVEESFVELAGPATVPVTETVAAPAPAPALAPAPVAPARRTPEWEREMRAFQAAFERERAGDAGGALAAFLDARRRWPRGAFAEERDLAILDLRARLAAPEDALAEADLFLREHPQDARAPEVLFRRAELRRRLGDCPDARSDYRAALERMPLGALWENQARAGEQACAP